MAHFVSALITGERCSASVGKAETRISERTDGVEEQPANTANENPFMKFWKEHSDIWTVQSTDGATGKCKRQKPVCTNNTGVLLNTSEISVATEKFQSGYMFWAFEDDNSTSFQESEWGEYRDYLLYQNDNKTCAVVRRDWFWYHTKEQKQKYDGWIAELKQNKSEEAEWARCINSSRTNGYICTTRPTHDLLVDDGYQDNVTAECICNYEELRDKIRPDQKKYSENCK